MLFDIPQGYRPWFNDTHREPNYRTIKKTAITCWLKEAQQVRLELYNKERKLIWSRDLEGTRGFNQFRWDLVYQREESKLPYFIHYEKFLESGIYQMILNTKQGEFHSELIVGDGKSPHITP
jgi:hypothetical protein